MIVSKNSLHLITHRAKLNKLHDMSYIMLYGLHTDILWPIRTVSERQSADKQILFSIRSEAIMNVKKLFHLNSFSFLFFFQLPKVIR